MWRFSGKPRIQMKTGQILCLIDFFNLSDKVIDSIQMNIICFDAEEKRIGGRLVRAGAHGEPRENFSRRICT